jgi:hypothetical protein
MFLAAFFLKTEKWRYPKCTNGDWINKMAYNGIFGNKILFYML